ncbi:uncharacterized protein YprB with RNaseH-like and TPR domain [Massilia sp. UYP32]|uniref:Exonuclease domain-containing protein n=1 Tax=Massilia timonae CCUG 45783 TaxID=883126 RepID=K9DYM2_9BURK|nr:hypothetical protein HMPREF9710_02353 [Massilia timonae CCUG 45783]
MRDSHYPQSGAPIVFFDVETTGLCANKDVIIGPGQATGGTPYCLPHSAR